MTRFSYNANHFFLVCFSKISQICICFKKGKTAPPRFILSVLCWSSEELYFYSEIHVQNLQTEDESESQFSTAPERLHVRLHTSSDGTWDKLTSDRRSDFTPHLPEAITIKKAKPIRDQAQGGKEGSFIRKRRCRTTQAPQPGKSQ